MRLFNLIVLILLFSACGGNRVGEVSDATPVTMRHASLIEIEETDSFVLVSVRSPWKKESLLQRYILVPDSFVHLPAHCPKGVVVRTPLKRVVVGAAVHAALMQELGAGCSIAGLCDMNYVVSDSLHRLLREYKVKDMGSSMHIDAELVRYANADALWLSPFENAGFGSVEQLGVPIIQCADYMETSPLGRAEWMRFYGRLVGCAAEADSLFVYVEKRYEMARSCADMQKAHPIVMADCKEGNAWFVPAGNSTMGRIFADAGAEYIWSDTSGSGSLQLDVETVVSRASDADVWIIKYGSSAPVTYASLAADFAPYRTFRPWRERRIFACNTFDVPFYEEVPFHPERLLENLINVFSHGVDGRYYKRIR